MHINLLGILVFMPMIGALLSFIIGKINKTARDYFADLIVIAELSTVLYLFLTFNGNNVLRFDVDEIAVFGLHFVLDGFRGVYTLVAALMWCMTTVFSKEYFAHYHNRNRYYFFMLMTLAATMGVFLSADLYTTFIFFEMMSFTSYVWVAHDEKAKSLKAAETYLAVAVIGGMAMLMGLFMLYSKFETLNIVALRDMIYAISDIRERRDVYLMCLLVAAGFIAKAGAIPLHIWLPKAHPVAPAPASALLSGILTKTGIYGLLCVSCNLLLHDSKWGSLMLIMGTFTMFLGALLAMFSIDLKRTLACSSMSQIGFILVGVGMQGLLGEENALAARGTLLHMMNHSLIKLVLFMVAGVVYMNLHKLDLNEIRGFGKKKPLLNILFLTGALCIGGIPLFNGYVSKTLLHESIVEFYNYLRECSGGVNYYFSPGGIKLIEWTFLISGGMTLAYMTKLYVCIFIQKNHDDEKQAKYDGMKKYMNVQSAVALSISAILLPIIGVIPNITADFIADRGTDLMNCGEMEHAIHYFSSENLKGACISLIIGFVLYTFVIMPIMTKKNEEGRYEYVNRWPDWLDLENLIYRPLITAIIAVSAFFCRILDSLVDTIVVILRKTIYKDAPLVFEHEDDNFIYWLGMRLNNAQKTADDLFDGTYDDNIDFVHLLSLRKTRVKERVFIITRTLSFGMLLCCFGMLVAMVYMLLVHW